jgi:hypothetical protein
MSDSDWGAYRAAARKRLKIVLPWAAVFIVVYALFLLAENAIGDDFHKCISDETAYYSQNGQNHHPQPLPSYFRFAIQNVCSLGLIDRHNGFFAFLGTIAVACFTFSLWQSTHLLWGETKTAAAAAAQQAALTLQTIELGNKEFIASHRPRIRIRRIHFSHFTLNESIQIRVQAANIGETNAKILAMGVDIYNPGLKYDASPKEIFDLPEIPPGKEAHLDFLVRRPWSQGQIDALKNDKLPVWLLGIIVYEDGNKTVRDTSFVRVYSPSFERFINAPDSHPEIDREYEN